MRITRAPRRSHFTIVPNDTARDHRLPLRALGLLTRLLSYPDGWSTDARGLAQLCPDGRDAISTALTDLERCGYLIRTRYRTQRGTWATTAEVFDEPQTGPLEALLAAHSHDGKSVMDLTSGNVASSQVRTMTAEPAPVNPESREEDEERSNPPTPPHAGGRCSRHPSGPVQGRPCRGCGTDRASRAAEQRRVAAAAASAAAAARAAARTGLAAERDPEVSARGAAAARAARAQARAR